MGLSDEWRGLLFWGSFFRHTPTARCVLGFGEGEQVGFGRPNQGKKHLLTVEMFFVHQLLWYGGFFHFMIQRFNWVV